MAFFCCLKGGGKVANKLKDLKITSTDLVEQGANPDAYIRLFKRKGKVSKSDEAETFQENLDEKLLRKVANEMWDFCYALESSLCSIICDKELDESKKQDMIFTSLDEFAEAIRTAAPNWAAGKLYEEKNGIKKSTEQNEAFAKFWDNMTNPAEAKTNDTNNLLNEQEETDTMKIDKSKMTAEEQATLAEFEKKYGIADESSDTDGGIAKSGTTTEPPINGPAETPAPELHPEVKKALESNKALTAEIEELKKSLEIQNLTTIAKKYEIIGKKPEELAQKLYEMKKAGGTAYADYTGLLDEQVTLVEKSGLFGEVGSNMSGSPGTGDELSIKAAEIRKSNSGMTVAESIAKAFEENPELAAAYEKSYMGGN